MSSQTNPSLLSQIAATLGGIFPFLRGNEPELELVSISIFYQEVPTDRLETAPVLYQRIYELRHKREKYMVRICSQLQHCFHPVQESGWAPYNHYLQSLARCPRRHTDYTPYKRGGTAFDSDSDRMGWVFNQRPAVCSNRRLIGLLAQWFRPLPLKGTVISSQCCDRMGWVFNQRPAVCSNRRLIGLLAQWFRPLPLKGTVISSQCWLVGLVTVIPPGSSVEGEFGGTIEKLQTVPFEPNKQTPFHKAGESAMWGDVASIVSWIASHIVEEENDWTKIGDVPELQSLYNPSIEDIIRNYRSHSHPQDSHGN
ncbi:hypothetical protein TREMEDRAFT_64117 [Tremella mesenterica DSM 1558]|uniref:uncharacterized protein n=1 Tax=Tremella mesenterica (strain ATCC 24925 / CBS 8224 / DSM 1558 / NBRC 9311 / NRRL Y-6157 / RJB 2259-6 / UBC 559-6) TaxID=578456 RepID=UPI0003F49C9E|nr:uncharacterized protein TREMEDRAFT_64117 [Tremella mesenterica DSM 1558]EIW67531.1 hypothetical protein TREMEDRAFT_64117 [Tremella mesenterica DSM 1558]